MLLTALACICITIATAMPTGVEISGNSIRLDLEELAKRGIKPDLLIEHLTELAQGTYRCGGKDVGILERHYLRNISVTCNDGSKAGYYIRRSKGSTRWLVFLEGGWFCFDKKTCHGRWVNSPHLMSSDHWPDRRRGTGILSWDAEENPYFYNANLVYVPYCSSDAWSGAYKGKEKDEFSYMGSLIIEEVIKDLTYVHSMSSGKRMFLAGSSAGGTGVLVNLDRIAGLMAKLSPHVEVRGIADSGWFLDNKQYRPAQCRNAHSCSPAEVVKAGIQLWNGRVPESCSLNYPSTEHWRCYFGYRVYPTMKTPVFVIQHLFDEAQITADNVGRPVQRAQWQYIHDIGQDLKRTVLNVSAVFAPACLSHILLTRSEWQKLAIDGVTLPEALKCWEDGGRHEVNLYEKQTGRSYIQLADRLITGGNGRRRNHRDNNFLGDDPKISNHKRKHRRKRRRQRNRNRRKNKDGERRQKNRKKNRPRRSTVFFDQHDIHQMQYHDNKCSHHRIDHCGWPQCNLSCPKIRNPFTGEEMDFIDLLMQFGIDLSSIAEALGMDLPTLQSMDHAVLLRLLTSQGR